MDATPYGGPDPSLVENAAWHAQLEHCVLPHVHVTGKPPSGRVVAQLLYHLQLFQDRVLGPEAPRPANPASNELSERHPTRIPPELFVPTPGKGPQPPSHKFKSKSKAKPQPRTKAKSRSRSTPTATSDDLDVVHEPVKEPEQPAEEFISLAITTTVTLRDYQAAGLPLEQDPLDPTYVSFFCHLLTQIRRNLPLEANRWRIAVSPSATPETVGQVLAMAEFLDCMC